jgi:hypothetical protein
MVSLAQCGEDVVVSYLPGQHRAASEEEYRRGRQVECADTGEFGL